MDIKSSFSNVLSTIINWIPNIIEFIIIVIIGYFVALLLDWLVRSLLRLSKLDDYLERHRAGQWVTHVLGKPSNFLGKVVFWVVWFGSFGVAASLANIPLVGDLVSVVYSYIPNILSALFIFVFAALISGAVVTVVNRTMGDTPTGKVVASVAPVLVMTIATFSILSALEIAPEIVQITYSALVGSIALGLALAFGLGGREVAGKMLSDAYASGQRHAEQVKRDVKKGQARGRQEASKAGRAADAKARSKRR
ncbi:MAG TPA: hypothetical protein VFK03_01260 [Candidatus Saccharimonadales bacterium]|nr:hypothetical protein [Candidatus Saccharimonadales bacterium]